MSLSSLSFIGIYFPILFLIYYFPGLKKSRKYKNAVLLLTSLAFYAMAEPVYIFLLFGSVLINFGLVQLALSKRKKLPTVIAIILDIAVLVLFKYINQIFIVLFSTSGGDGMHSISFPIGLSYFTFQEISYCVDSLKEKNPLRQHDFWDFALFICDFTRIVSGPIGFSKNCIEEIQQRNESWENVFAGVERFSIGLIKKIIIADSLLPFVNICFGNNTHGVLIAWAGAIAYSLELYFDFSGYTDMAIGIGRIFGFHMNENFNFPYTAVSVSDFWKRWHMSLTKWFTQYLYIDFLGGSHVSEKRHIFNLFVVWICTGLWHGSGFTFVVWGMIYFLLQALEKYTGFDKKLNSLYLGRFYTLIVVICCWVIFRSANLSSAFQYLGVMFGIGATHFIKVTELKTLLMYSIPLIAGIVFSLPEGEKLISKIEEKKLLFNLSNLILFIVALIIVIGKGYSAPLYANF